MGKARTLISALLASAILVALPLSAEARIKKGQPMVPKEYFATHLQYQVYGDSNPEIDKFKRALSDIHGTGFRAVRVVFSWIEQEPRQPLLGNHTYKWDNFDRYVRMAAVAKVRVQAMYAYGAHWASSFEHNLICRELGSPGTAPDSKYLGDWEKAIGAFAKRYGRDGTFWEDNPNLPYKPIVNYEIWNEANLKHYWCPFPEPEKYADFLTAATNAIRGTDPLSEIVFAGITLGTNPSAQGNSITAEEFVRRVFDYKPELKSKLSAIGVHPYAYGRASTMFGIVREFRGFLHNAGVPDEIPMQITEIGWPNGGDSRFTEEERARRFKLAFRKYPRSNCNISGVTAYAWITKEEPGSINNYLGLVSYDTLDPYPAVATIKKQLKIMRGRNKKKRPPTKALLHCPGMPPLDRDGDGIPDQDDPKPLKP